MYHSVDVVAGAQFGSESKGRVTADLIRHRFFVSGRRRTIISVRVGGPNAGHVVVGKDQKHFAMRQIPVGFIEPKVKLYIAAGSEVDFDVLHQEIEMLEQAGYSIRDRLYIDPQATVLTPKHIEQERESDIVQRLGSTAKGIGAARADRIWRNAKLVKDFPNDNQYTVMSLPEMCKLFGDEPSIIIEGTQGYGLGLHAGYYPQCTSNNARALDFLAMAGVNPWESTTPVNVHLVVRPYPIRVAGNSGPMKSETTWEELGLKEERTTVTQKVRRVGLFDLDIVKQAVAANGPSRVFMHLAMADQVDSTLEGVEGFEARTLWGGVAHDLHHQFISMDDYSPQALELMDIIYQLESLAPVITLGTGPSSTLRITGNGFDW